MARGRRPVSEERGRVWVCDQTRLQAGEMTRKAVGDHRGLAAADPQCPRNSNLGAAGGVLWGR